MALGSYLRGVGEDCGGGLGGFGCEWLGGFGKGGVFLGFHGLAPSHTN